MKSEKAINQQNNLKELIKLMQDNPTLRVVAMVNSDVVADDGYGWWIGNFGEVSLEEIYSTEYKIYIKSEDEEELLEEIVESYDTELDLSSDHIYKKAEEDLNKLNWEKVIVVNITL